MKFRVLLLTLLVILPVFAQLPKGVEQGPSVEGITEYRLANGMKVLLFPDPSKPVMTVNLTILVGSRHEGYGETGMAHLLEHMVYKGTPKHPDPKKEIGDHGGNFNGSTYYDRTNYFETFPASDENLKWALEMESDRMMNSFVSRKDLDTEMTVVRNEFEMGENEPALVLEERVLSTAFLWHNYGKSTIGARSDIENVPIENLQAFYRKYYQPDNAVLVVAGKIEVSKTLALISDTFGVIPRPARKLAPTYTEEPTQDGERTVTLRRTGGYQALAVIYHVPAGSHPDFAAVDVLERILADNPSGRLYKALVESRKATGIGGEAMQLHDPGMLGFQARVKADASLAEARKAMLSTIEGVLKEPPTKEEVERSKTALLKQIDLSLNNSGLIGIQLSEWASMSDWRMLFLHRDRIKAVTPEDVLRVAKAYLKDSNRTLGEFIPEDKPVRAEIPPTPDVTAVLKNYKGSAAIEQGEAFDASPANIESRVTRVRLENGMRLVLLPKKTRGNSVTAVIQLHYGDEQSLSGQRLAGSVAASMLMRGSKKHTKQQIQDEFNKLKAQVNVGGAAPGLTASVTTVGPNLVPALRLLAEVLREPAFPDTELELVRQARISSLENAKTDPQALAGIAFQRQQYPYPAADPRATVLPDEEIAEMKKLPLDAVKGFYDSFVGASNAEVVLVGDFDGAEMQKLLGELFGNWKSPKPFRRLLRDYQKVPADNQMIETPDKQNAMMMAGLRINVSDENPDYPALLLTSYLFGLSPQSRLNARIREKEGLSYGVAAMMMASPGEQNTQFLGFAIFAPQNVLKVESAFKDELSKLLASGFTAEEVASGKKGWLQSQQTSRAQDGGLARQLAMYEFAGRTMAWEEMLEQKVNALTPERIQAALKKYIDPEGIAYFKAGDFKKAGVTK